MSVQNKRTAFRRFFFLFLGFSGCLVLSDLAACAELSFLSLGSALFALCAGDDIDNNLAAVHTRFRVDAVSEVGITRLVARDASGRQSVMRPALGGLGSVSAHSNNHIAAIIQI